MTKRNKILVTGAAGFIGFHLSQKLCQQGHEVVGIDTINDYYDVQLKLDRLACLKPLDNFKFYTISITDKDSLDGLFEKEGFNIVINLAAQAGVRFSIEKPYKYLDANLIGFLNVLEASRYYPVEHLIFASSSSVYGSNTEIPFSEHHHTAHPVSLYAATKKANEMLAHSYASLYQIPCTGLRFFTVYGPWGRPDMAYFKFTKAIIESSPIKVFNHGNLRRDFTYIDDIVFGISRLMDIPPQKELRKDTPALSASGPFRLCNIGNNQPVSLIDFIHTLEDIIGTEAKKELVDMQPGDVLETYADITELKELTGYAPTTDLKAGLTEFIKWYKDYYDEKPI